VWAGVDKVWEQENAEARKMPVNRAESHTSGAPTHDGGHHISRKKQVRIAEVYCGNRRQRSRTLALVRPKGSRGCTVVSDHDDLSTGGALSDPD